jgi:hypothetical protein
MDKETALMPRYIYRCKECEGSFMTVHGITEDQDHCELCYSSGTIFRIPQMPSVKIMREEAGQLTREFIEDSKRTLEQHKKDLKKEEHDQ